MLTPKIVEKYTEKYGTGYLVGDSRFGNLFWFAPKGRTNWIAIGNEKPPIIVSYKLDVSDVYDGDGSLIFVDEYGNEIQHPKYFSAKGSDGIEVFRVAKRLVQSVLSGRLLPHEVSGRCVGRTTGLAFKYISDAMLNHGQKIKVVDHHETYQSSRYLRRKIQDIIEKNELDYFKVYDGYIIYEPTVQMKRVTKWEAIE